MTGRLKNATKLVEEEPESYQDRRKLKLKMGVMNVRVQKQCQKVVTQKNVRVCRFFTVSAIAAGSKV